MRSLVTLLISAISIGNTVVIVVPEEYPIAPLMLAQVRLTDCPILTAKLRNLYVNAYPPTKTYWHYYNLS